MSGHMYGYMSMVFGVDALLNKLLAIIRLSGEGLLNVNQCSARLILKKNCRDFQILYKL
jgi:hypothetical protein